MLETSIQRGIVNSVVSKNDPLVARAKLTELGLMEFLVAPRIAFKPKGEMVKAQIEALQLREQNVLFVDDNPMNLNEVKFYCPKIKVLDARDESTDDFIENLISKSKEDGGKRHKNYEVLSRKMNDEAEFNGDNEAFLRQSGIKIAIVSGNHNFRFAHRIEELVNRSNQMNFLKSRIPEGTGTFLVGDSYTYTPYSVFVRDRFGSYGLVGFACLRGRKLIHFAFSCRIMNMKIENVVMDMLVKKHGLTDCPVRPENPDYITVVGDREWEFAADMDGTANASAKDIMVMANCQSGIIAHYLGAPDRTDAEQAPESFSLRKSAHLAHKYAEKYDTLIYGIFVDYMAAYWGNKFTLASFTSNLQIAFDGWAGVKVYVLLPPGSEHAVVEHTSERTTFADLNNLVVRLAEGHKNIHIVRLADFVEEDNDVTADLRHYSRTLLKRVSEHLRGLILDPIAQLGQPASQSRQMSVT
ncbi:FkbH-like protein [Humitalea rosea]|uniref:FkbH-like protein n=1 Tax=Humitalea rosea TaxID=990373 RepID=A0A2W7KPU2_9PROT|nr:FkbH-like protein [Humitalea rosea]